MLGGDAVAFVVKSEDPKFRAGDAVEGMLGWQEYAVARGRELRKIDTKQAPISTALGVLGTPGLTAYFGLLEISAPRPGETVLISGAAGAVGMMAGQIAKICGCRVVGVVGTDAKVAWLTGELDFDAAFNYKTAGDLPAKFDELCPEGIDVYFDIVGGAISDAAVQPAQRKRTDHRLRAGFAIQPRAEPELGPRWLSYLIAKQATVRGFKVCSFHRAVSRSARPADPLAQRRQAEIFRRRGSRHRSRAASLHRHAARQEPRKQLVQLTT